MPRYLDIIESRLNDDATAFASVFGQPRISPWIIDQYGKGHTSPRDYEKIVDWITNENPNLSDYNFSTALARAKQFIENRRKGDFDPYAELSSNNIVMDFDTGHKWLDINKSDLSAVINRLQFDCHDELSGVYDGNGHCWALIDPQDNINCIMFKDDSKHGVIGSFGKPATYPKEIKSLCVRKGFDLVPEAYDDDGLSAALKSKALNVNNVRDKRELFKRISADDIITCGLLDHAHYAPMKTVYDLYCKTSHPCLLKYAMAYMVAHGHTSGGAYDSIKALVNSDPDLAEELSTIDAKDNRAYIDMMDDAISEIVAL